MVISERTRTGVQQVILGATADVSGGNGKNGNGSNGSGKSLLCPHCGGRLFLESDIWGKRLLLSAVCVNCAREYNLSGKPVRKGC